MTASAAVARSIPGRWRNTPDTSLKTSATGTPEWSSAVTMPRQQGHVRGGRNAVARDVADDQRDPLAVEEKAFVPVASDRVGLARWEIASR